MAAIQWASSDDEEFPDLDVVLALASKKAAASKKESQSNTSTRSTSTTATRSRKPPRRREIELGNTERHVRDEQPLDASSGGEKSDEDKTCSRQPKILQRRRKLNSQASANNPMMQPLDNDHKPARSSRQPSRSKSPSAPGKKSAVSRSKAITPPSFSSEDEDSFYDAKSDLESDGENESDYEPMLNRKTKVSIPNGADSTPGVGGTQDGRKLEKSRRHGSHQRKHPQQSTSRIGIMPSDSMLDALSRLDINSCPRTPPKNKPSTTSKTRTLVSPQKLPRIPQTPHRPSTDLFWDQQFVDEWNEEHSPKKLFLPPVTKTPGTSARRAGGKTMDSTKPKETKKSFLERRHQVAEDMLRELDDTITHGQLSKLAASTGGIKIQWSKTLNTTAGRANWKRERIRSRSPPEDQAIKPPTATEKRGSPDVAVTAVTVTEERHHASIELAEKVIDDEHRLVNVIAHEFCHLTNFMISGVTGNPHGKEFKAWAAKVSRAFGDRGIEVTTKHTYEIDFKYIWECTECGTEYKRHSKSLNPQRHRCGACKSLLRQTKPVPRANTGKKSEYQIFLGEQMKLLKQDNPGSPQKDLMKQVAKKWAARAPPNASGRGEVELEVAAGGD